MNNNNIEQALKKSLFRLIKAKSLGLECIVRHERQVILDIGKKYKITT